VQKFLLWHVLFSRNTLRHKQIDRQTDSIVPTADYTACSSTIGRDRLKWFLTQYFVEHRSENCFCATSCNKNIVLFTSLSSKTPY